jgi:hypothetical protein
MALFKLIILLPLLTHRIAHAILALAELYPFVWTFLLLDLRR